MPIDTFASVTRRLYPVFEQVPKNCIRKGESLFDFFERAEGLVSTSNDYRMWLFELDVLGRDLAAYTKRLLLSPVVANAKALEEIVDTWIRAEIDAIDRMCANFWRGPENLRPVCSPETADRLAARAVKFAKHAYSHSLRLYKPAVLMLRVDATAAQFYMCSATSVR